MNRPQRYVAVVLAADRVAPDPVAVAAGVGCKALAPVADIPMVLRVLNALDDSAGIEHSVLCGPPWTLVQQQPELQRRIENGACRWLENRASPAASAEAALRTLPEPVPILLTTADHALLTPQVVDYFCIEARRAECDVVVGLALYEEVAAAFPGVRRTVLKFSDQRYCGCNLFAFPTPAGRRMAAFWQRVERHRKQPWRVIGALGWGSMLRYALGRMSLAEGLERLSQRLQLRLGAVLLPFPEAAVDVDSVADWQLVQNLVTGQRVARRP
jgi:GTP:adenosylcobinamide-phosphate guanylyltransferase